jgi:hypothetical protein
MKKKSEYKQALDKLRENHADELEDVYNRMAGIIKNGQSEDRDAINAAKVMAQLLGVARPVAERPEPRKPADSARTIKKPELPPELKERLKNLANGTPAN